MKARCKLTALMLMLSLFAIGTKAQDYPSGIDVSYFQDSIKWADVAKHPHIKFVYIRSSEGASVQDIRYKINISDAKKAGLLVGSYHIYSNYSTVINQMKVIRKLITKDKQDLIPMLDIEDKSEKGPSYDPKMECVDSMLILMEQEYGVKPIIYTSYNIYKMFFQDIKYKKYHFYIAKYNNTPPDMAYTLWQYTEKGRCSGIEKRVDFCCFNPKYNIDNIKMPASAKKASAPTKK